MVKISIILRIVTVNYGRSDSGLESLAHYNGYGNEPRQKKRLMSRIIAAHVRYKFLYISLLSAAKQQRVKWLSSACFGERRRLIFRSLEMNAGVTYVCSETARRAKPINCEIRR